MSLNQVDWMKNHYNESGDPDTLFCITCKYCLEVFFDSKRVEEFLKHLYCDHNITESCDSLELDNDTRRQTRSMCKNNPKHDNVIKRDNIKHDKFDIIEGKSMGICNLCGRLVTFQHRVHILQNHLELFHGDKSNAYAGIIKVKEARKILKEYILTGNKAKCAYCEQEFDLEKNIEAQLLILNDHSIEHITIISRTSEELVITEDDIKKEKLRRKRIEKGIQKLLETKFEKREDLEQDENKGPVANVYKYGSSSTSRSNLSEISNDPQLNALIRLQNMQVDLDTTPPLDLKKEDETYIKRNEEYKLNN